ncbi:MAG: hypothetical protein Q8934_15985 [Bacillota bacterium]|nr:hypothetical protein [Bacillota bacterium]
MTFRIAERISQFTLEFLFVLILLFFYFIAKKEEPPIFLLFLLSIGSFSLLAISLEISFQKGKWLYFIFVIPCLLLGGNITGIPTLFILLLGFLVYWRGIILYDGSRRHGGAYYFFSNLIGFFVFLGAILNHYPYLDKIVYILVLQYFLQILVPLIQKWFQLHDEKWEFAKFFIKISIGICLLTLTITFLEKYIGFLFFKILKYIVLICSYLMIPLFDLLKHINLTKQSVHHSTKENIPDILKVAGGAKYQPYFLTKEVILFFIIAIACIGIFFILRKVKKYSYMHESIENLWETKIINELTHNGFRAKQKVPNNGIRKELVKFEKYTKKLKYGRHSFETLQEWLNRLDLIQTEMVIALYEMTRYGEKETTIEEQLRFKNEIRHLKHQLLLRRKGNQ